MEDIRLEGEWKARLTALGWPDDACKYYNCSLASSSINEYNRRLTLFKDFCSSQGIQDMANAMSCIPSFLISVAKKSQRPDSVMRSCTAALQHFFKARIGIDPINEDIHRLVKGLIRQETLRPREQTKVMPVKPFTDLCQNWGSNESLSIQKLRQKAITLLALSALCRPSDIAPISVFKRKQIEFTDKGMNITLFGIKNDSRREGFNIFVSRSTDIMSDPVSTLRCYIDRTDHCAPSPDDPVFVTVSAPYTQLSAQSVSCALATSIKEAGLPTSYTPRCFRVTGAQTAISKGVNSQAVKQLGRWRSEEVMWKHYCPVTQNENITDAVLRSNDK